MEIEIQDVTVARGQLRYITIRFSMFSPFTGKKGYAVVTSISHWTSGFGDWLPDNDQ